MANLGQIIVNRVKPLLDTANSAGYSVGYEAGYDSGYISGEESVRDYVDIHVERSKKAIVGRGGEISSNAGLEDLPDAIFNIPADASLAHYTDDDIAYRKSVPVGAEKYALLKSVGGMTYKCNNLIPYPYIQTTKTENGITFTDNGDGSVTVNGTATNDATFSVNNFTVKANQDYILTGCPQGGSKTTYYMHLRGFDFDIGNGRVLRNGVDFTNNVEIVIKSGTTVSNLTFKPMLNYGTTALPYEPYFEGLRDSKGTEIVSYGANLFDDNALIDFGFTKVAEHEYFLTKILEILDKGAIFTNTSRASGSFTISAKLLYKNVGTTSSGLFAAATYTDGTVQELHPVNGRQGEYFNYIVSTKADKVLDYIKLTFGSSTVDTTIKNLKIARGNVTEYTPYREPISKPIPKALQDIDGWGWGIPESANNYADFENEQFAKPVEKVVFDGTESWYIIGALQADKHRLALEMYNFAHTAGGEIGNIICSHYEAVSGNDTYSLIEGISLESTYNRISIYDENYQDANSFKTHLAELYASGNPFTIYYELAEPIITDISDILTDDNFIEVESGGSLEFVNEYKNAVPSTVKYTIKVGS